jgi:ABC-type uncharacterized transport system fused permease/ATPase subunit
VICRALLFRRDILFLDEATSAVDVSTEAALYRLLLEELPDCAIVSISSPQRRFQPVWLMRWRNCPSEPAGAI